jgi:opacity protein-like surface antigen
MLFASNVGKYELYLNGAIGLPMSPEEFSDYWQISVLNFGVGFGYPFTPIFSTTIYFDYGNFGFDGDKFAHDMGLSGVISVDGLNASIITITANFKAAVPTGTVRPYFSSGGGFFLLSRGDGSVSGGGLVVPVEGDSEDAFGINVGAGIEYAVARTVNIFLDGRYVLGFTEGESTRVLPIKLGMKVILR